MARIDLGLEIQEIGAFFEGFRTSIAAADKIYSQESYRTWVRRLIALQIIVYEHPHQYAVAERYLRECFSDAVSAFSLAHLGYYKSVDHLMRAAIENLCRAILVNGGMGRSVRRMRDARQLLISFEKKSSAVVASDVGEIRRQYAELSKSIHTSSRSHMALCDALERGSKFSRKRAESAANAASALLRAFLAVTFADYVDMNRLRAIRPVHLQDFFLDNVRHSLKKYRQERL